MFIHITRVLLIISAFLLVCALGYLGFATYQINLIGWFIILTAFSYGLGGPYLLWIHMSKEGITRQEKQDRSFWLILPGFLVAYFASPLEYLYLGGILPYFKWMQIIGLVMIFLSLVLFGWARLSLKDMYSGRLQVKLGHTLVRHGPYRMIRHPAYAAYIIMSLGIAIGYSSLIGLLSIPLLLIPGLIYRIIVEEKILAAEFGEQYNHYAERTSRLFPGIW